MTRLRMMLAKMQSWEGVLICVLIFVILLNSAATPQFLTLANQINLFQLSIEKIIVALTMTFVIVNAEIDLSVGSMMGLSACAFGWMVNNDVSASVAISICLLIGVLGGYFNAFFITRMELPSLVVTLATLIAFRGLARVLVEDRGYGDFPDWFDAIGQQGFIGPIPFALLLFIVMFVFAYIALQHTGFGRKTYVIGTNRDVAEYAGIDTARHKSIIFVASGLVSAIAGLLYAARVGAVRGDVAFGFELDIITIVLLGGVSIFGGTGTMLGTLLAILIVLNLRNGMALLNITGHIQTGVIGVLLIASVLAPRLQLGRRRRAEEVT